ncbi:MAG: DUF1491 family protein [Rhodobacteraceae bacterium]|nr:DUF1491 family protein [Paracoccaceae bacterium]
MRVTSEFYVTALVRRIFADNGFAAISQKGSPEAGAIYIIVDRLDGSFDFYGPAPQAMFMALPDGRLFEKLMSSVERDKITERVSREARMDPDFWVVEIEAREGAVDLPLVEEEGDKPSTPEDNFFKN